MTEREVLQLALEALEVNLGTWSAKKKAIPAIKEVLAQPEREPVVKWDASAPMVVHPHPAFQATTSQRTWVGLTDEEINLIYAEPQTHIGQYARAIEAKLKEKNT